MVGVSALIGVYSLLPAFSVLFAGSFYAEHWIKPQPIPLNKRSLQSLIMHTGIILIFYGLVLLIFQRPWFASATGLALVFLLLLVNNVKMSTLREPFIHQDFEYFWDLLRHPRLYLPFFGVARTLAASLFALIFMGAGLFVEPALEGWVVAFLMPLVLICAGVLFCLYASRAALTFAFSLNPAVDVVDYGFVSLLGFYTALQLQTRPPATLPLPVTDPSLTEDIFVIQSESFFDPRKTYSFIKPDVLSAFDIIRNRAALSGSLAVPVWGANTVRTEFSFLSGLAPGVLGVRQFNPYHWFAKNKLNGPVEKLRSLGYHTVCIHPYSAEFYRRDEVFPNLGFETFIDIRAFDQEKREGQYIGDQAIGDLLIELMEQRDERPLFVFIITMENHGPLHLEKPDKETARAVYVDGKMPSFADDLTVYLKHLCNADTLVHQLMNQVMHSEKAATLCWYGDHVPIMEKVYQHYGAPDGKTEYFIWRYPELTEPQTRPLEVHQLFAELLNQSLRCKPIKECTHPNKGCDEYSQKNGS